MCDEAGSNATIGQLRTNRNANCIRTAMDSRCRAREPAILCAGQHRPRDVACRIEDHIRRRNKRPINVNEKYSDDEPARSDVDRLDGPTLIEFGTPWCGYCRGAQPSIAAAIAQHPRVRHLKISDGPGRPLGRSFRVKLWPTLVFLQDGREVSKLVRPAGSAPIAEALAAIDPSARSLG